MELKPQLRGVGPAPRLQERRALRELELLNPAAAARAVRRPQELRARLEHCRIPKCKPLAPAQEALLESASDVSRAPSE